MLLRKGKKEEHINNKVIIAIVIFVWREHFIYLINKKDI